MSRIWDALKKAQQQSAARKGAGDQGQSPADRRRSERVGLDVPLFVYGHTAGEEPFFEETRTLEVNAYGGLLILGAKVKPGQKLLLTNKLTQQELECCVVHVAPMPPYKSDVGVAFTHPAPDFWRCLP